MTSFARPPAEDVNALLARVFGGERRAAHELTERILLPVLDVAVSRALLGPWGQRFEKMDVIQSVFQHIYEGDWRRLRLYDAERGSLANYVWAVARGWLRDHLGPLPAQVSTEDAEEEVSPDSSPEERAALLELMRRLGEALTVEELALFQWVYLEGVSHAIVGERLGISVEAVHKRVQRLEAKIRALLSEKAVKAPKKGGTA